MAIASGVGATIDAVPQSDRVDTTWFGESATRAVIALDPVRTDQLAMLASEWGTVVTRLGSAGGSSLRLPGTDPIDIATLTDASESALQVGVEADMA
jgi:phosphoribosylformylglycinamidine synthase